MKSGYFVVVFHAKILKILAAFGDFCDCMDNFENLVRDLLAFVVQSTA